MTQEGELKLRVYRPKMVARIFLKSLYGADERDTRSCLKKNFLWSAEYISHGAESLRGFAFTGGKARKSKSVAG